MQMKNCFTWTVVCTVCDVMNEREHGKAHAEFTFRLDEVGEECMSDTSAFIH